MEFGSVVGAEPPVDRDARGVTPRFHSSDGTLQSVGVRVSAFEAGSAEHAESNLRHVQPTGILGGVVNSKCFTMRRASSAGKVSYKDAIRWVFRLSRTTRITGASLHARTIRPASARSSRLRYRLAWGRSCGTLSDRPQRTTAGPGTPCKATCPSPPPSGTHSNSRRSRAGCEFG